MIRCRRAYQNHCVRSWLRCVSSTKHMGLHLHSISVRTYWCHRISQTRWQSRHHWACHGQWSILHTWHWHWLLPDDTDFCMADFANKGIFCCWNHVLHVNKQSVASDAFQTTTWPTEWMRIHADYTARAEGGGNWACHGVSGIAYLPPTVTQWYWLLHDYANRLFKSFSTYAQTKCSTCRYAIHDLTDCCVLAVHMTKWMRIHSHRPCCASWRRKCRRLCTLLRTRPRSVVCATLACSCEWIVHCVGWMRRKRNKLTTPPHWYRSDEGKMSGRVHGNCSSKHQGM